MNATETPTLHPRLALLRSLVARQGGEWTPARVQRAYAEHGSDAPKGHTHKRDLKTLWRMGVLNLREQPGRQYYVPATVTNQTTRGTA
jgi:hypothetical protein